ncbi:hypothetical protein ACSBR2_014197 [Camellia fascicularis]
MDAQKETQGRQAMGDYCEMKLRNKAADLLANIGVAQNEHVVFLDNPPAEVVVFFIDDMIGFSFVRD